MEQDVLPNGVQLRPGDCLLYKRTPFAVSIVGWLTGLVINIKTWSKFSHVEVYDGGGMSLASRDGLGVARYPLRRSELAEVRRPREGAYNHVAARDWFVKEANGQKYDWAGLLVFALAVKQGSQNKMFCSEFATRLYRKGGCELFNPAFDADRASPEQLHQTPSLVSLWIE